MTMRRVIVYGATGAIGRALLKALLIRGATVLVLGRPEGRMREIPPHPRLICRACTLQELKQLQNEEAAPFDVFFHLGWAGTTGAARHDTALQLQNVAATLAAIEAAARFGCHTFVGIGSQAEYGKAYTPLTPLTPTLPQNAYGAAKLAAGHLSREAAKSLGMRHIWVRVLSVYGPYDNENALFSYVARTLLSGHAPDLTDGTQLWDFLYADDAAAALCLAATNGLSGATYVLGSGIARPLRERVTALRDLLAPDIPLNFGQRKQAPDSPTYLCADISALISDVGWHPTTPFDVGIAKTAAFLREKHALAAPSPPPHLATIK
ncbi:MAG: NAD(P)-dependent oxidoreductase [Clostridia bacterium]|nr:NAD(P)-dependent oxidoreductase [Clostridia bacterium]